MSIIDQVAGMEENRVQAKQAQMASGGRDKDECGGLLFKEEQLRACFQSLFGLGHDND